MKHLLVAGNGFVGRELCNLFMQRGWQVSTLSRSGQGDYHADLTELSSLVNLKAQLAKVDVVVHCASAGGRGNYRGVYLEGVKNLLTTFPESKLYFTSSTSVYPQVDGSEVTEESATSQIREGANLLLAAENVVTNAGGVVLRLAGLYGSGRSYLLKRFLAGEAEIEEDGARILNYTHHEDAAEAIWFLENFPSQINGEIYNVCDSSPRSQAETYSRLCRHFQIDYPPSVERKLESKRGWSNKAVSNSKLKNLGWEPKYPSFVDIAPEVAKSIYPEIG